jgi:hypothetical protein
MQMMRMTSSKMGPSVVVDTVASEQRVGSEAVNPEATVASASGSNSPRALLVGTLKAVGVWASRPWNGP